MKKKTVCEEEFDKWWKDQKEFVSGHVAETFCILIWNTAWMTCGKLVVADINEHYGANHVFNDKF